MHKFLTNLNIIQNRINFDSFGETSSTYRLNPFNPLSYILIIFVTIIGLIMFGCVGMRKEMPKHNPFKWQ